MRLVLIQGDHVAVYEGREQLGVWRIDWGALRIPLKDGIEELRVSEL